MTGRKVRGANKGMHLAAGSRPQVMPGVGRAERRQTMSKYHNLLLFVILPAAMWHGCARPPSPPTPPRASSPPGAGPGATTAFEVHLQGGFEGGSVIVTVDGDTVYTGTPRTNPITEFAKAISATSSTVHPVIGIAIPGQGITRTRQVDLTKGHVVGLSVSAGAVQVEQAESFGYR